MKIVKLTVENIMRVSAVEITPDGNVVVIGGKNAQGKTSVLTAILMGLGGGDEIVEKPIRDGQEAGRILIDLGEIQVERVFRAGSTKLYVRQANGATFPSPQSMLDHLIGKLSFDPLSFARAKDKDQANILRACVGLDTSDLDRQRAEIFAKRTEVNRDVERVRGHAASIADPTTPGMNIPDSEPDPAELMRQLESMQLRNRARSVRIEAVTPMRQMLANNEALLAKARGELEQLERSIQHARNDVERKSGVVDQARADLAQMTKEAEEVRQQMESDDDLKQRIATCHQVGTAVRAVKAKAAALKQLADVTAAAAVLTAKLDEIDAAKRERIAALRFPIDGLALDAESVSLNGIPFSQASSAEQLRASVAIGMALNPRLRVMIVRDGSLLDDDGMRLLNGIAETADVQLWVERVGKGAEVSFVIEDGHLEGAPCETCGGKTLVERDDGNVVSCPACHPDAPDGTEGESDRGRL